MKKYLFIILFLSCYLLDGLAQTTDSLSVASIDSTASVMLKSKKKDYPNPKKAALLGLTIPGAGHIYNKKRWYLKLPIVYGGLVGGIYFIQSNNTNYRFFKDAYCAKLIVEEVRSTDIPCPKLSRAARTRKETFDFVVMEGSRFNSDYLRSRRDFYDKNLQITWVGVIAGHLLLNGVWPFVDAHLNDFDLSDDLTLKLKPQFETISMTNSSMTGVSVLLKF